MLLLLSAVGAYRHVPLSLYLESASSCSDSFSCGVFSPILAELGHRINATQ
jgi:hypothetical protein